MRMKSRMKVNSAHRNKGSAWSYISTIVISLTLGSIILPIEGTVAAIQTQRNNERTLVQHGVNSFQAKWQKGKFSNAILQQNNLLKPKHLLRPREHVVLLKNDVGFARDFKNNLLRFIRNRQRRDTKQLPFPISEGDSEPRGDRFATNRFPPVSEGNQSNEETPPPPNRDFVQEPYAIPIEPYFNPSPLPEQNNFSSWNDTNIQFSLFNPFVPPSWNNSDQSGLPGLPNPPTLSGLSEGGIESRGIPRIPDIINRTEPFIPDYFGGSGGGGGGGGFVISEGGDSVTRFPPRIKLPTPTFIPPPWFTREVTSIAPDTPTIPSETTQPIFDTTSQMFQADASTMGSTGSTTVSSSTTEISTTKTQPVAQTTSNNTLISSSWGNIQTVTRHHTTTLHNPTTAFQDNLTTTSGHTVHMSTQSQPTELVFNQSTALRTELTPPIVPTSVSDVLVNGTQNNNASQTLGPINDSTGFERDHKWQPAVAQRQKLALAIAIPLVLVAFAITVAVVWVTVFEVKWKRRRVDIEAGANTNQERSVSDASTEDSSAAHHHPPKLNGHNSPEAWANGIHHERAVS